MNNSLDASTHDLTLVDLFGATLENLGVPAVATIIAVGALVPLETVVLTELSYFPGENFSAHLGLRPWNYFAYISRIF
jgi:hypothetical protein